MREILFRGKPVNKAIYTNFEKKFKNASFFSNGFVFGSLVIYENKYYICLNIKLNMSGIIFNSNESNMTATLIEVIPETVSQYTGITDDNGEKIFEGDILGITNCDPDYNYITKVYLDCDTLCVDVQGQDYDYTSIGFAIEIWDYECDQVEIIGNIYDNPELLEVEE